MAIIQHLGRWGSAVVGRYVEHALEDRAAWAPLVAACGLDFSQALGAGGCSNQASFDLRMLDDLVRHRVRAVVRKRKALARPEPVARDERPSEELALRVEAIRAELQADIARVADTTSGVLVAIRSPITRVGHLVRCSGYAVHPSAWETHCGWRFAAAPHEPCTAAEVTCRRGCLAASRQVG
jgi:hypothetical protein